MALYEAGRLVLLRAVTPVHAGVGRTYGEAVDLPVQRDEFGVPVMWGSSLKGAIRAHKELNAVNKVVVKAVFGPDERAEGVEGASSMSILDARLVAMPVRSLKGLYAYITSHHLLQYYKTYLEILRSCASKVSDEVNRMADGVDKLIERAKDVKRGSAIAISDRCIVTVDGGRKVVLNERVFDVVDGADLREHARSCLGKALREDEVERLVIVSDEVLHDLIRTGMQVITRVALDYSTKTVKTGALWSEEYVPTGTVFVTVVLYSRPRMLRTCEKGVQDERKRSVCEELKKYFGDGDVNKVWEIVSPGKFMILGGHETIGKGIVQVIAV